MRVLVTGGSGLVGKGVEVEVSGEAGEEWVFASSRCADLRSIEETRSLFATHRPTHVLHLAARVGGLFANMDLNLDFYKDNASINENVMQCCAEYGVEKTVSCLSTCIFPDKMNGIIDETKLHDGLPHASNMGYAYAKRSIDVLNKLYASQTGRVFTSVVPTNVYGPHDNFSFEEGHVLPALMHKCLVAKRKGGDFVVSGSGKPLRQFIYSEDLAKLLVRVVREYDDAEPLILSVDAEDEVSICYAAMTIADACDFKGSVVYDTSKADGQFKKTASNKKLRKLFPDVTFTPFEEGVKKTCDWLASHFEAARGVNKKENGAESKVALITGITGQDGSYLAELLLSKGYEVHGIIRRASQFNTNRIDHIYEKLYLHYGDITDSSSCYDVISTVRPDEVYNLAAQSHVQVSFQIPEYTANADALGAIRILDAVRSSGLARKTRVYQASTSELYGKVREIPQTEETPFYPRSPYAVSKQFAFWLMVNYREAYGMHLSNGILFNHESPRRGETFVTRKITMGVARIHLGMQDCIVMGNIDSKRDWGHAKDYVEMMWRMLQKEEPGDYVAATGVTHTIRSFIEMAFRVVKMEVKWRGEGVGEVGYHSLHPDRVLVRVHSRYFRPAEVDILVGDASKAERELGWKARTTLDDLCTEMVNADIAKLAVLQETRHAEVARA